MPKVRKLSKEQLLKIAAFFCQIDLGKARKLGVIRSKQTTISLLINGWTQKFSFEKGIVSSYNRRNLEIDLRNTLRNDHESFLPRTFLSSLHSHCKEFPAYAKAYRAYDPTPFLDETLQASKLEEIFNNACFVYPNRLIEAYLSHKSKLLVKGDGCIDYDSDYDEDWEEPFFNLSDQVACIEQYVEACMNCLNIIKNLIVDLEDALKIWATHPPIINDDAIDETASFRRFACIIDESYLPLLLLDTCGTNREFAQMYIKYLENKSVGGKVS
jgi:hypothetical protein